MEERGNKIRDQISNNSFQIVVIQGSQQPRGRCPQVEWPRRALSRALMEKAANARPGTIVQEEERARERLGGGDESGLLRERGKQGWLARRRAPAGEEAGEGGREEP